MIQCLAYQAREGTSANMFAPHANDVNANDAVIEEAAIDDMVGNDMDGDDADPDYAPVDIGRVPPPRRDPIPPRSAARRLGDTARHGPGAARATDGAPVVPAEPHRRLVQQELELNQVGRDDDAYADDANPDNAGVNDADAGRVPAPRPVAAPRCCSMNAHASHAPAPRPVAALRGRPVKREQEVIDLTEELEPEDRPRGRHTRSASPAHRSACLWPAGLQPPAGEPLDMREFCKRYHVARGVSKVLVEAGYKHSGTFRFMKPHALVELALNAGEITQLQYASNVGQPWCSRRGDRRR
jgi:hypothetical protein